MDYLSPQHLAALAAALGLGNLVWRYRSKQTSQCPLPPGPKPLPLIGNLLDLPKEQEWRLYTQWAETYGDVVSVIALGQRIVVLSSAEVASGVLDHFSAVSSDRPQTVMMKLMNWDWLLGNVPYSERWRLERRLLHDQLHVNAASQWRGIELRATRKFLKALSEDSGDILGLVSNLFGVIVMDVAYGADIPSQGNHYTKIALEAMEMLSQAFLPGSFLVDMIPPLRYVPRWLPGAGFQRLAAASRERTREMLEGPYKVVQDEMAAGTAERCLTTQLLDDVPENGLTPELERAIRHAAGHAYAAGSDTMMSTIICLFLAMARYPKVLAAAQTELDAVVGFDQLPDFTHHADLPYIQAVVLELLRWHPVVPIGVPHKVTADIVYKGYLIPKGSTILPNQWAILHDAEEYAEPDEFRPERFLRKSVDGKYELDPSVRDPRNVAFGYGRRICSGMHFAEQSLFIVAANVLAAFDITAPLDDAGNPVYPEVKMTSGLISHPEPFECVVKPRSKSHEELVGLPLPERGL